MLLHALMGFRWDTSDSLYKKEDEMGFIFDVKLIYIYICACKYF
jgi:hypothetical protein